MIRIAYIAATASLIICAAPAFAQDVNNGTQQAPAAAMNSNTSVARADTGVGMDMSGQSASGSPVGLTRSQVRQQLIQAEQDGQLKYLNGTLYKGS
ncbi:hypothetical protein [Paraburkholderia sp.]|uniref:hypothetical protein n=1 Tax=Paraburkholderia sp. TaxID=1926495 RepID=UPI002F41F8FE